MLLTRQSLLLLLLTTPFLALGTLGDEWLILAFVYLGSVLAMIVMDYLLSPAPTAFQVERVNEARLSLGVDNLIIVRVTHRGRRATRILARDEFPSAFAANVVILDSRAVVDSGNHPQFQGLAKPAEKHNRSGG